jgi:hypothetical protein
MTFGNRRVWVSVGAAVLLMVATGQAHHEIAAKFDPTKPLTISGVVTLLDWRDPHAHIFINVKSTCGSSAATPAARGGAGACKPGEVENWAAELDSPIALAQSGWTPDSLKPGDTVTVKGWAARNGSRQISGNTVTSKDGKTLFTVNNAPPPLPASPRPTPRWSDNKPRLGPAEGTSQGYWAYPSATVLAETGTNIQMDADGLLKNIADAPKVAPMQPWALQLYRERQQRFLQDDPQYLYCKPPGGPRQFEQPEGVQFVEDKVRQRVFVLMGGGNNNYRIIYTDGRTQKGSVRGDDDNPLYFGRSVGKWDGDTFVVDTTGFNEDFWFTNGGLPHTDKLRLIEKFTRTNLDTMKYEVAIDDVGAYTRQWSSGWTMRWVAGQDMPRHYCQDNRP